MRVIASRTGSSGNSSILEVEGSYIIIDVGVPPGDVMAWLDDNYIYPWEVAGIVVTHSHYDHNAYVGSPSWQAIGEPVQAAAYDEFTLGEMKITCTPVQHDRECVALLIECNGERVGWITDCGKIPDFRGDWSNLDLLAIECNHSLPILNRSRYTQDLRLRVATNHLSTIEACEIVNQLKPKAMMPLHVSHNGNNEKALYADIARWLEPGPRLIFDFFEKNY